MRRSDTTRQRPNGGQEGTALLMVLGIVAATTLLATHMLAVAETIAKQAAVNVATAQLRFQCESAVDFATWMHLTDRRLVSNRNLGASSESRSAYTDFEPWMMDGQAHPVSDTCNAYVNDAVKSFSVENIDSVKENVDPEDAVGLEDANTFIDMYKDYIDNNDLLNIYGRERDDYAALGFPTLPRNEKMMFKAELYWLDNWNNIIAGDITVIPPKGVSMKSGKGQKPNFFTASEEEIRDTMEQKAIKVSASDILTVIQARREWQTSGTPLEDLIPGELLINVKNYFSFDESDYAEITAVAVAYGGTLKVKRTVTREVNMKSKSFFSDRQDQTLSLWEAKNY